MFNFLCSLFFSLRLLSKPLQYSTSPQILLQPWQECVFVTLKRALTLFSTSSFSSGDFSVMTCVGKTQAIHKAFYKSVLKMASPSYLPAPTPLPHFHLLQLIHPTLLLKKACSSSSLMLFGSSPKREATIQFPLLGPWPPFVLFFFYSAQPIRKRKNAMKVNNENKYIFEPWRPWVLDPSLECLRHDKARSSPKSQKPLTRMLNYK